jgi:hypothetical protein
VGQHADDLAVIRSCVSDGINHAGGVCQMNTVPFSADARHSAHGFITASGRRIRICRALW